MTKEHVLEQITLIFRSELEDESIQLEFDTTADDVEGWDSITHVQLIVAIERKYGIRFTSKEIQGFKNVGELCEAIIAKKGN